MAMGRPIITTNAPGCKETVVDGQNGYLIPVKDTSLLVDRMLLLANSPSLRAEMGERSHSLAVEKYDVSKVNRMLISHIGLEQ